MEKKLFRNEHDKMIAGVASGLADYMQVEVTIVRLLFVLSTIFAAGGGLIAYIIIWIIAPVNNDPARRFNKFNDYFNNNNQNTPPFGSSNPFGNPASTGTNWSQPLQDSAKKPFETQGDFNKVNKSNDAGRTVAGLLLLVMGCFFLMHQLDFIPNWFTIRNLFKFMWPFVFIALGISIIAKSKRKNEWAAFQDQQAQEQQKKNADFSQTVVNEEEKSDNNSTSTNL